MGRGRTFGEYYPGEMRKYLCRQKNVNNTSINLDGDVIRPGARTRGRVRAQHHAGGFNAQPGPPPPRLPVIVNVVVDITPGLGNANAKYIINAVVPKTRAGVFVPYTVVVRSTPYPPPNATF